MLSRLEIGETDTIQVEDDLREMKGSSDKQRGENINYDHAGNSNLLYIFNSVMTLLKW